LTPATTRRAAAPGAEHISLESTPDIAAAPAAPPHRKVRSTFKLRSALRGCSTEVSILEDHYLAVRSERLRMPPLKYVVDLRFASPKPVRVRHVAWNWMIAAMASTTVTICAAWWFLVSAAAWTSPALLLAIAAGLAAAVAAFFCLRRTTESLEFTSVNGGVPLVSILGGIGSAKAGKRFFVDMIKSINAAKVARPQTAQHFLRDEMREHHRLRELNVLSDAEYAASKGRILAAHS
jgi:hypothetical protein